MAQPYTSTGVDVGDAVINDVLARAATQLSESWQHDVLPLRASRLLHKRIAPLLGRVGNDGYVVGRLWYQEHVLASIRRMVDTGPQVVSIRQALVRVREVADNITPSVLLDFHGPDPEWDDIMNMQMAESWVRLTVEGARPAEPDADFTVIGRRTVQADLDRIRHVADRAHRLATHVTAHRLDSGPPTGVTDEEVDRLLTDISSIYSRWSIPLRGVDVDTRIDHFQLGHRLAEALQLYDHDAVVEAAMAHMNARRGLDEQPPTRSELVSRMKVRYEIPPQGP